MTRNVLTLIGMWVMAAALGAVAIVGGGVDDAPGLQLIGLVIVLGATGLIGRRLWRATR